MYVEYFLIFFSAFILSNLIFKLFQLLKTTLVVLYFLLISQSLGRSIQENYEKKNLKWLRMAHNGFYWDTFSDGFGGGFQTMKKRGLQVNKSRSYVIKFIYIRITLTIFKAFRDLKTHNFSSKTLS